MTGIKKYISFENARCLSPRVRLWVFGGLAVIGLYAGIFYAMKTFGANKAFAFSRPALVEMDEAAMHRYREDMRKLLVKEPEQIKMLLGQDFLLVMDKPDLERRDAMMTMWQYRSDDCVLDVYLKPAEDQNYAPVMHYEIRQRRTAYFMEQEENGASDADLQSCLTSILSGAPAQRQTPQSL